MIGTSFSVLIRLELSGPGSMLFFVSALAETNRVPFDLNTKMTTKMIMIAISLQISTVW